jgi:hypothetical protein
MKQDSVETLLAFGAEKRDRWTAGLVSASFEAGHGGQGQGQGGNCGSSGTDRGRG